MPDAPPLPPSDADRATMAASAGGRLALIAESFARLAGRPLVDAAGEDLEAALWSAPRTIVAHGSEDDPLFFYGNARALELFAMSARVFIGMPSRESAEPALRGERQALFARLERDSIVEDYSGVRVAADGRRFRIEQAQVWNLIDRAGSRHGQAATFTDWTWL